MFAFTQIPGRPRAVRRRTLRLAAVGAALALAGGTLLRAQTGSPLLVLQTAASGPVQNSIGFGTVSTGSSVNHTITLSNGGGGTLTFSSMSLGGANATDFSIAANSCAGAALGAGQVCTVTVSFRPGAAGARSGRLNIGNNALGSPHQVPLSGIGVIAGAPQKTVGPIDLRIGYPASYADQNGLALAPCIDDASMCLTPIPDLTKPPSVTGDPATTNFNDEFFYYDVEATFPHLPDKSLVRLVLEGAFNTADLIPGEQIVFGRIRIRISGLKPNVTYRISHPYGHDDLVAEPDVTGGRINFTDDFGSFSSPSDFREVLNARTWPFLTWAPLSAAPAGFIGDPNVLHAITPGPGGNFIRIEELNAAGAVVARIDETNQFTVSGRIANGVVPPQTPNQAPIAGDDTAVTTEPDAVTIRVLENDIDPDGDPLQMTSVSTPPHGTAEILNNGAFITYTPEAGFSGNDSFTYTIDDFRGGSATARVTVTVNPGTSTVNNPPVAAADTAAGQTRTPIIVGVLLNDTDPDGDPLSVVSATGGAHGTTTVNSGLTVTYKSANGFVGTDTFSYTIDDAHGNTATGLVTVTVTAVPPVNHPPVANPDAASTLPGTAVVIDVVGGTTPGAVADSDPDGDGITLASVTQGVGGLAGLRPDGMIGFTPAAGFAGTASFTYTITDGITGNASALVTVSVLAPNRAPVAAADSATTTAGVAVNIPVLANDSDPDGDVLSVALVASAVGGTAVIQPNKTVTFTPNAGFTGAGSFSYTISDGRGATASASVSVTVNPAVVFGRTALVSADGAGDVSTAFSPAGGTLLVAFVAADGPPAGANTQQSTVSGGGLTWTRLQHGGTATVRGSADVWVATAPADLGSITVTSTLVNKTVTTSSGTVATPQSLTVAAFSNATIGASIVKSATGGVTVNLTAQAAGSFIYAVANDYNQAANRTAGAGQSIVHQMLTTTLDTLWVQMRNAVTTAPGAVTINTTAPAGAQYNIIAVEIKPLQ